MPSTITLHPHEIRALLDGRLSMLWRPFNPQPSALTERIAYIVCSTDRSREGMWKPLQGDGPLSRETGPELRSPFGPVGNKLRVREAWNVDAQGVWTVTNARDARAMGLGPLVFAADKPAGFTGFFPASQMPSDFSRFTIEPVSQSARLVSSVTPTEAIFSGVGESYDKRFRDTETGPFVALKLFMDLWTKHYPRHPFETAWAVAAQVRRVEA